MQPKPTKLEVLLSEVDALCQAYVGRKANGEPWLDTMERLRRIAPLVRTVKGQIEKDRP
jgi:hypothetical protein